MLGIVKTVAVILLLVLCGLVALIFWILCRSAKEEFSPVKEQERREDRCESCLRWSECAGVDESCPMRKE